MDRAGMPQKTAYNAATVSREIDAPKYNHNRLGRLLLQYNTETNRLLVSPSIKGPIIHLS